MVFVLCGIGWVVFVGSLVVVLVFGGFCLLEVELFDVVDLLCFVLCC